MTNPILSTLDFQRLKQRINQVKPDSKVFPIHLIKRLQGVDDTTLMEPANMPADVITMNSEVCLEYISTGKIITIRLVYPEDADSTQNRISVYAPMATALLGRRRGEIVSLATPFGQVKVRISQILYQPEAAGDLAL